MNDTHMTVVTGFVNRCRELAGCELAEALGEEQFWRRPFRFGNSFEHVVLHLTGNRNFHVGAEIAGTGYAGGWEREFTEESPPSKQEVMKRFHKLLAF